MMDDSQKIEQLYLNMFDNIGDRKMSNFPIMYKRNTNGSINQWQIFVDGDSFYTEEGQVGGVISRSKPTKCEPKNVGRANWTTAEEQAIAEAEAKIRKQKDKGYTEDINNVDSSVTYYKPMLAHKFAEHEAKVKYPIGAQVKLDGIRCVLRKDGGWTRNGKKHMCIPHIEEAYKPLFDKYPNMILDGELYNHDLHDDFNRLTSLIKKTKPTYDDLEDAEHLVKFYCYDAPVIGNLNETNTFMERYKAMRELLKDMPYTEIVKTEIINSKAELGAFHQKVLEQGYEGAIVRVINAPYENKRSKNLLKLKIFDDDEFIIEGIIEGKGNKTGMAGAVETHSKSGQYFTSNIKGPHSLLRQMWLNKQDYIGKKCTIRYFGLTPDKLIPRFPYVIDPDRMDAEE